MYKNYLYLLRSIEELRDIVLNKKINEIYTQEKDKLFISIQLAYKDNFHIIISTNPQLPYLLIKNTHFKAKKNVLNFFEDYLPSEIKNIEIALGDRIIKFTLSSSSLYFRIFGPRTNIYLLDSNNKLLSFKKINSENENEIINDLSNKLYISSTKTFKNCLKDKSYEQIINEYKFIDKQFLNELNARNSNNINSIIEEFFYDDIRISFSKNEGSIKFEPSKFFLHENYNMLAYHKKYFDALSDYLNQLINFKFRKEIYYEIKIFIDKQLEMISNKLNSVKSRIDAGSKANYYTKIGNLLLANIYSLKKGLKEINLLDEDNKNIIVPLDEKLSPNQNIDKYFERARNEKLEYEKLQSLYNDLTKKFNYMREINLKLEKNLSNEELLKIKQDLKIKSKLLNGVKSDAYKFRHFIVDNKYHLFVGKDSHNNDELTLKFAKQNDLWFHARSVKGSHVVLRIENTKETIPKSIISKAASVAAFFSKAKTYSLAPVSYTFKKYVVKRKGMEPGQVYLLKEDVVIVKPEIPSDCEQVTD